MRRIGAQIVVLATLAFLAGGCSDDPPDATAGSDTTTTVLTDAPAETVSEPPDTTAPPADDAPDDDAPPPSFWPAPVAALDPADPPRWTIEVLERTPHDPRAFTQGLELLTDGRLVESTGVRGLSDVRIVDPTTGAIDASMPLDDDEFGEGLTVVGDTIIQLTWQAETARRWRLPDLDPLEAFTYAGEGWGLCLLGDRLAMTDGTSTLQWRDPATFALLDTVEVSRAGQTVSLLNEIECVDGHVVANIWQSSELVVISPSGAVVATIDASVLVDEIDSDEPAREVLNGIAAHPDGTFSMTGKLWPTRFLVRIVAP